VRPRRAAWRIVSFALALAGIGVAAYLTFASYDDASLVCGLGDCHAVQASRYAKVAGVPVALLGLGMYGAVVALGLVRWRRPAAAEAATIAAFALALAGTLYAAYLTYLELAVIDAVCQWCVVSAGLTFGLLLAEGVGVARLLRDPDPAGSTEASAT
jgi:uncharacterized membrane protein